MWQTQQFCALGTADTHIQEPLFVKVTSVVDVIQSLCARVWSYASTSSFTTASRLIQYHTILSPSNISLQFRSFVIQCRSYWQETKSIKRTTVLDRHIEFPFPITPSNSNPTRALSSQSITKSKRKTYIALSSTLRESKQSKRLVYKHNNNWAINCRGARVAADTVGCVFCVPKAGSLHCTDRWNLSTTRAVTMADPLHSSLCSLPHVNNSQQYKQFPSIQIQTNNHLAPSFAP
jgi:hypothetical protein